MSEIKKHMNLLGLKVKDKVTNMEGVVTSLSFDLYGCVQAIVTPFAKENKKGKSDWYDVLRLEILDKNPVMKRPNFDNGSQAKGEQGCAFKPLK